MKIVICKQGTPPWFWARLGVPTASQFSRVLTAKTRKLAAGSESYMHELLAEWLTGIPSSAEQSGFMERGSEMEAWAVGYYELQRGVSATPVGTCIHVEAFAACSPDRLVGDDGGLEIKCPSAKVHIANLLDATDEHYAQAQGNLWITGRKWWDLLSYHPTIPPTIVRIERDEEYIAALAAAMKDFVARLLLAREKLTVRGCTPAAALDPEFVAALNVEEPLPPLNPEAMETLTDADPKK